MEACCSKLGPLRSREANLLRLECLLSLQKHVVDAIVCIFNPNSVSQAARQCALLGLTTLAVRVRGRSRADNIRTGHTLRTQNLTR